MTVTVAKLNMIIVTAAMIMPPALAFAQNSGMNSCHGIGAAEARLECYGGKTGYDGSVAKTDGGELKDAADAEPSGQQWLSQTEESALDGPVTFTSTFPAPIPNQIPSASQNVPIFGSGACRSARTCSSASMPKPRTIRTSVTGSTIRSLARSG